MLTSLKSITTLTEFAKLIDTTPSGLSYILFKKPEITKYKSFDIPKKRNGSRTISAPCPELKLIQQKALHVLSIAVDDIKKINPNYASKWHGFHRKTSILTNAQNHRKKKFVLNIDIQDFFDSINFGRVRGFFIKDKNFCLHPSVATIIAQIACYNNKLPQGSPLSPLIANLIGNTIDSRLSKLCKQYKISYTRYADDISISTNNKTFPDTIATSDANSPSIVGKILDQAISSSGFVVNTKKTRLQHNTSRQVVTGLVVNNIISVPREYQKTVRAMAHALFTKAEFNIDGKPGKINQLHGMLAYINSVNHHNSNFVENSYSTLYQDFLFFRHLYSSEKPTLICEGKTDYIYIKCAIKMLADKFPELASQEKESIEVKIKFYKESKRNFHNLRRTGGTPELINLVKNYIAAAKKFSANIPTNPVIITIDNDEEAKKLYSTIKQVTGQKQNITGNEPYLHVYKNLYVTPVPKINNKDTMIEDLFDTQTKNHKIEGKTFSTDNNYEKENHYGKNEFANEVIMKNYQYLDFSGFIPLLSNISNVIKESIA